MVIRGVIGSLRWGYHRAADLRHWTVRPRDKTRTEWALRAHVVAADRFLAARSAVYFVAMLKGGRTWQWPIRELAITGYVGSTSAPAVLTATLGPMDASGPMER